jgi:hypothetical protein
VDYRKIGSLGSAMSTVAWLLAAMAFGWEVSVGALDGNLLFKLLDLGFRSGMLGFPIACLRMATIFMPRSVAVVYSGLSKTINIARRETIP